MKLTILPARYTNAVRWFRKWVMYVGAHAIKHIGLSGIIEGRGGLK